MYLVIVKHGSHGILETLPDNEEQTGRQWKERMTLILDDVVSRRFYKRVVLVLLVLVGCSFALFWVLTRYVHLEAAAASVLIIAAVWVIPCLVESSQDRLGFFRMTREHTLGVRSIEAGREMLCITGRMGWQFTYLRASTPLSKKVVPGRGGKDSWYLCVQAPGAIAPDVFFLGYEAAAANKVLAALAMPASTREPGVAAAEALCQYIPVPKSYLAPCVMACLCCFFGIMFWQVLRQHWPHYFSFGAMVDVLVWGGATGGCLWPIIGAFISPNGLRVTPTSLQLVHAWGKIVDYAFTTYTFEAVKNTHKGVVFFALHVRQGKKCIKKIGVSHESEGPSDALRGYDAVCEMFFTHLLIAQDRALGTLGNGAR